MRRGWLVLAGLLAVSVVALGNAPPTMEDQYVTTVQDTPVTFELRAQDEDIDPNDPEAHPLRFVLVAGPRNGVLVGDMSEVRYEGPHDALIEVTYVPAAGFVGTDVVTIAVYDPFDETASGTVTIEIDVTERRAEGLLSGNWSMQATFLPQSGSFTAFGTQLTEVYRIGRLRVKGIAGWGMTSVGDVQRVTFKTMRLEGDVSLDAVTLASTLSFDPDAADPSGLFDYWRATVGFALQGVRFRHTFYLDTDVTRSYQTLFAEASVGGMSFTNTARFDVNEACVYEFGRNDAVVGWRWCDLRMRATLSVTCAGFQQAGFNLYGFPILEYLSSLRLDAGLTFTVDAKRLTMTLVWQPATTGCIRLYSKLEVGGAQGMTVEGLSIYGMRVEGEIGGVRLVSATSFDAGRNSSVTGQTDYWEVVRATGTLTGCSGMSGTWGLATYFYADSTQLFDWGMTKGRFSLAVTEQVNVNCEAVYRSGELGDPNMELSFGWTVRW